MFAVAKQKYTWNIIICVHPPSISFFVSLFGKRMERAMFNAHQMSPELVQWSRKVDSGFFPPLDLFNAELSQERCWRGPITLERRWEGELYLLLFDRSYIESPVCKINVAIFSNSSLLPYSLMCNRTAVGHTFVLPVCRSGHLRSIMFGRLVFKTAVVGR